MKKTPVAWVALTIALAFAGGAQADSSEGGAFRLPGYGARAWGLAGAATALIDDESALDWSPARLSFVARSAGASYVNLVPGADLGQSQLVFVTPFGAHDAATGVSRHAAGVMFTNLSADISGGESYSENHLRGAYAFSPEPFVSVAIGLQAFLSRSGVAGFDAWGTAVDLAGRVSLSPQWDMAVVARDAFSRFSYDDGRDYRKSVEYAFGLATRTLPWFVLEGDLVHANGSWSRMMLGAESDYLFSTLALRAGVGVRRSGESRTVASMGASVRAFDGLVAAHYAAVIDDETAFGTTHRVSLALRL